MKATRVIPTGDLEQHELSLFGWFTGTAMAEVFLEETRLNQQYWRDSYTSTGNTVESHTPHYSGFIEIYFFNASDQHHRWPVRSANAV